MQRRSPVEQEHGAPTPEILPANPLEHGDKLDIRPDAIDDDTAPRACTDTHPTTEPDPANVPVQRPSTAKPHAYAYSTSALAASPLPMSSEKMGPATASLAKHPPPDSTVDAHDATRRRQLRNPWACSSSTLLTTLLGFAALLLMVHSFLTRQLDVKGCNMSYMRPSFTKYRDFDTEHTRFATKYSLYLYREGGIDDDIRVPFHTHTHVQQSHGS